LFVLFVIELNLARVCKYCKQCYYVDKTNVKNCCGVCEENGEADLEEEEVFVDFRCECGNDFSSFDTIEKTCCVCKHKADKDYTCVLLGRLDCVYCNAVKHKVDHVDLKLTRVCGVCEQTFNTNHGTDETCKHHGGVIKCSFDSCKL
jgi:hypothetical protein